MRILFIAPHGNLLYGGEKSLLLLLRELCKHEVEALVVSNEEGVFTAALRNDRIAVRINPLRELTKWGVSSYLRSVLRLIRCIRDYRPGIVHCNSASLAQIAIPAARLCSVPVVVHVRTGMDRGGIRRYLIERADAVIFNSIFTKNTYENARSLPGAVHPVIYNPITERSPRPSNGANNTVLMMGQLAPHKGCESFMGMVRSLLDRGIEARFVMAGGEIPSTRGYAETIRSLMREQGLHNAIDIRPHADSDAIFNDVSVVVVPSLKESFGRVAAEAMMAGIPVVASRVGGLPEVVADNVTGFLVDPDDVDDFADKVQELLSNPDKADAMGRAGRERAIRLFSPQEHAAKVMQVYQTVLGT